MSDNKITFGWMAMLVHPIIDRVEREEKSEELDGLGLFLNYEGTLIGSCGNTEYLYDAFGIHFLNGGKKEFKREVKAAGYEICQDSVTRFVDMWYDGADATHHDITLEDFQKKFSS